MVSQYSILAEPYKAPAAPAANKQTDRQQDAKSASFESHLRHQDRREPARSSDEARPAPRDEAPNNRDTDRQLRKTDEANPQSKADTDTPVTDDKPVAEKASAQASTDQAAENKDSVQVSSDATSETTAESGTTEQPATARTETPQEAVTPTVSAITPPVSTEIHYDAADIATLLAAQKALAPDFAGTSSVANTEMAAATIEAKPKQAATPIAFDEIASQNTGNGTVTPEGVQQGQNNAAAIPQNGVVAEAVAPSEGVPSSGMPAIPTNNETTIVPAHTETATLVLPADVIQPEALQAKQAVASDNAQSKVAVSDVVVDGATKGQLETAGQPTASVIAEAPTLEAQSQMTAVETALSEEGEAISQVVSSHQTVEGEAQLTTGMTKAPEGTSQAADGSRSAVASETAQTATMPADSTPVELMAKQTAEQPVQATIASQAAPDQPTQQSQPQTAQSVANQQNTGQSVPPALTPDAAKAAQQANSGTMDANGAATTDEPDLTLSNQESSDLPAASNNEPKAALRQAPKADAFTKMMAGVDNQGGLKDMAMQSDPTLKIEVATPFQGDGSTVRLTGMESFARTGQVPQQAATANAQAMAAQISKFAQKGETRFEIRLDPADLGKVDVRLTIGSDGQTRAHLFVERSETLDMLMRDQRMLERSLAQSGLNLDKQGVEYSLMDQNDKGQQFAENQGEAFDHEADTGASDEPSDELLAATAQQTNHAGSYLASDGINLVI